MMCCLGRGHSLDMTTPQSLVRLHHHPMFQFTIRNLILTIAFLSVGMAWWLDHRRLITAQDRLDTIVAELASRDIAVEIDADGVWVSNP
jgi:hypothetical protein